MYSLRMKGMELVTLFHICYMRNSCQLHFWEKNLIELNLS